MAVINYFFYINMSIWKEKNVKKCFFCAIFMLFSDRKRIERGLGGLWDLKENTGDL